MADAQPTAPLLAALQNLRLEVAIQQRELEDHKTGRAYCIGYGQALDRVIGMIEGGN